MEYYPSTKKNKPLIHKTQMNESPNCYANFKKADIKEFLKYANFSSRGALNKIQHPFMINTFNRLRIIGTSLV